MTPFFKKYIFFPFLLPIFFVFHVFTENYDFIPVKETFLLLSKYLAAAFLLILILYIFLKDFQKAGLITFFLMAFNFFFGNFYDFLGLALGNSFLTRYSFLIPASLILLAILSVFIKKKKSSFSVTILYLNWLFIILILLDIGSLLLKLNKKENQQETSLANQFTACDSCTKPDIYLIVADEYAGQKELKDIFNFDNSAFLNDLKKRDYHVLPNSSGNYNFTHYCMASTLNMEYLSGITGDHSSSHDLAISFKTLKQNNVLNFFLKEGYSFYNYSIFNFDKQPAPGIPTFIPSQTAPITSQTFLGKIYKDLGHHLVTTFKLKGTITKLYYNDLYNNNKVYELTKAIASTKTKSPKFVYTHLVMPHYRYYFDRKGKPTAFEKVIDDNYCADKNAYLEYLQYSNGELLALIDHIKQSSEKTPIIILMSDHGYHQFLSPEDIKNVDTKYYFMNLNAVYFPDQNYAQFYDSMSNVNQFRVILNSQFAQKLPLLKDSTVFLAQ